MQHFFPIFFACVTSTLAVSESVLHYGDSPQLVDFESLVSKRSAEKEKDDVERVKRLSESVMQFGDSPQLVDFDTLISKRDVLETIPEEDETEESNRAKRLSESVVQFGDSPQLVDFDTLVSKRSAEELPPDMVQMDGETLTNNNVEAVMLGEANDFDQEIPLMAASTFKAHDDRSNERHRPFPTFRPTSRPTTTERPRPTMRPTTERPRTTTGRWNDRTSCRDIRCPFGTFCSMERERCSRHPCREIPTCLSIPSRPQDTCSNVRCPPGTICNMQFQSCSRPPCFPQPVCIIQSNPVTSSPPVSCSVVQCPIGTTCKVRVDPSCLRSPCQQTLACVSACEGVQCPFSTECRVSATTSTGFICAPIVIDPCFNTHCFSGSQCQNRNGTAVCVITGSDNGQRCFGQNELYRECASQCEPSCINRRPACILSCAPSQCQCSQGFFRDRNGRCVTEGQCDQQSTICGVNESFNGCSGCEQKCGGPELIACPLVCGPPKCECLKGFYRHWNGSCVRREQCFSG